MEYGFVYIWYDRKHKRYYIGAHWGDLNDGYICSSSWMRAAYSRRPLDFKRRILSIIYTNRRDMFDEEAHWQSFIKDIELRTRYYNIRRHGDNHWSVNDNITMTVREKMSCSKQGEKNPMYGKSHTEETKKKMSMNSAGFSIKAREESKKAVKGRRKSLAERTHQSEMMRGRLHSEETKKKISIACKGKSKQKNVDKYYNDRMLARASC